MHSPAGKSLALETLCACRVCMCVCVCLFMWGDDDTVVFIYFITSFKELFNYSLHLDIPYHSQFPITQFLITVRRNGGKRPGLFYHVKAVLST